MARCKCSEISTVEADINDLNKMTDILSKMISRNTFNINFNLMALSMNTHCMVKPDNLDSLLQNENRLNYPIRDTINKMDEQCSDEKVKLEAKLESLRSEDEQYHNEEGDE